MTPDQIKHCAQVALYTKVHAVRLMQAGPEAVELAKMFLDLFHGREFSIGGFATSQEGQDLLALVASGYQKKWARARPKPAQAPRPLNLERALIDLSKTPWTLWVMKSQVAGRFREAEFRAQQFLRLREQIEAFQQPLEITRAHGKALVTKLFTLIDQVQDNERKSQKHETPYLATRRRVAKRPRGRGLGF